MQVKVVLEQPTGKYTNLDFVRGKVLLRVFQPSKVSFIVAKLEGESRTRLEGPNPNRPDRGNKVDQLIEIHKLLYKVQRVFPPPEVAFDPVAKNSYMLAQGSYEYPFEFKIPFNNSCIANLDAHGPSTPFNAAGFNLEVSKGATSHVRTTLPPTMHHNLEAGIRYYVKATVNVPSIFKENPRETQYFSFDPIEPPRTKADGEAYARRQHQFSENPFEVPKRKFSLKLGASNPSSPISPGGPNLARFSVDVRTPNPAILTCGQEVALRILVRQISSRSKPLYLKTFQIELVGHTRIRAQRLEQVVGTSWVLTSLSNLNYTIGSENDPEGTETELSRELWSGRALPDAVCPSFMTCNIERYYELVVSIGLSYGSTSPGQDQFTVLPLRHRVQVFSGIRPPDELLQRMAEQRVSRPPGPIPSATMPAGIPTYGGPAPGFGGAPSMPPRPGMGAPGSGQHPEDPYLDPPPSYEDAMADNILPVQGPRPGYNPQPGAPGQQGGLFADEKR